MRLPQLPLIWGLVQGDNQSDKGTISRTPTAVQLAKQQKGLGRDGCNGIYIYIYAI